MNKEGLRYPVAYTIEDIKLKSGKKKNAILQGLLQSLMTDLVQCVERGLKWTPLYEHLKDPIFFS